MEVGIIRRGRQGMRRSVFLYLFRFKYLPYKVTCRYLIKSSRLWKMAGKKNNHPLIFRPSVFLPNITPWKCKYYLMLFGVRFYFTLRAFRIIFFEFTKQILNLCHYFTNMNYVRVFHVNRIRCYVSVSYALAYFRKSFFSLFGFM